MGSVADDVFLSPRVVDRQAFNDFAVQLRDLIEQVGTQAETLRTAAAEAQRTRDGLRESMNANQMKLEMVTRALASIDQRAEQARRMIEGAADVAVRVDGLREQADQVIQERVGICASGSTRPRRPPPPRSPRSRSVSRGRSRAPTNARRSCAVRSIRRPGRSSGN